MGGNVLFTSPANLLPSGRHRRNIRVKEIREDLKEMEKA
jgi:hypothetical protein